MPARNLKEIFRNLYKNLVVFMVESPSKSFSAFSALRSSKIKAFITRDRFTDNKTSRK